MGELVAPGAQPSIKDGAVNGTQVVGSGSVYEISAALDGGMSGGPTVDHTGRVLGVISLRGTDTQQFNFAVPASGIAELPGRNGARNELGPRDLLHREALDAYHTGEYTDAIDALDRLLREDVPMHAQASKLRTDAESAREQHDDAFENHLTQIVTWLSLGIGIVVVIVVGALLVVRGRRTKPFAYGPAPHGPVPPLAYAPHQGWPGALVAAPPHHPAGATDGPGHPYALTVQIRAADPAEDPPGEPVPASGQLLLARRIANALQRPPLTAPPASARRSVPIRRDARREDGGGARARTPVPGASPYGAPGTLGDPAALRLLRTDGSTYRRRTGGTAANGG